MQTVTVSPNFELPLPASICEALHIKPGQQIQVLQVDNRIELIPQPDIKQARGFLKGIDTSIEREEEDRL
jgi:AbrB family looped-hinge helix DNA binding protein